MNCSKFIFFLLILTNPIFLTLNAQTPAADDSYTAVFTQLMNLNADPLKSAKVSGLEITRETGTLTLKDGRLYLCTPVNGTVCAAVFTGKGTFSYTPPDDIEKEQLERFYETRSINKEFESLFIIFADSTLEELESKLHFQPDDDVYNADNQISWSLKFLGDEGEEYFDSDLIKTFLEQETNGSFYSSFYIGKGAPMFFRINPLEEEEVTLEKRTENSLHHDREIINQFPASAGFRNNYSDFRIKERFSATGYKIVSRIDDGLNFYSAADVMFSPKMKNQKWIHFYLYRDLDVDSVFVGGKTKCEFHRGDDNNVLWVHPDEPFVKDESYRLTIYYHGDVLDLDGDLNWISLVSPDYWFPRLGYRQKVIYHMTFSYPSKYKFAASGDKLSEETADDFTTSVWMNHIPARNASFNIGLFKEYKTELDSLPAVTVYINRTGISELRNYLAPQGILLKDDMEEQIAGEINNCFKLYDNIFGPTSFNHIYATPIPYYHGEAFPGLVHLSWITYHGLDDDAEGVVFRAHEIAHQWWGIGVDFKTYHDQWLSEGFAEYAGLWFAQYFFKGNDEFFRILDKWKDQIINNRKYLIGSGQEAGPISLGYRTQSNETEGDYDLIIYKKGAWVLQMLRNMLIDLKTMNEDKFEALLNEFYSTYVNEKASTEDFKKICDKYMNQDMTWFFKQWVYGTDIPKYTVSYKTDEVNENKYNLTCRIIQDNVPNDFKDYTIIQIKFDDDKSARLRVKIDQPVTEFTIPLPAEPEEIIFNDLQSTLCEVDYEDWR